MGTGELTFWNSGVWLIPIILFATVGGLYLLVRYWRNKTRQDLKQIRSTLRGFQNHLKQLIAGIHGFSPDDPEPYGSQVAVLLAQMDSLTAQIVNMERQHVVLQERIRTLASNRWQAAVGAPYFWYVLRQDVAQLQHKQGSIQSELEATGASVRRVSRLGWEVAARARQIRHLQQQVSKLLEELLARHIQGQAVDEAVLQEERCRKALAQIPPYFLSGGESSVLEQTTPEGVSQTHAILEDTQPVLEALLAQLQEWEDQHAEAFDKVSTMRQQMSSLDKFLGEIPPGLNLTPLKDRFDQLKVIEHSLHGSLSRLEAESMKAVAEEAGRVHQAALEIEGQFHQARQQLSELEQALAELSEGLKQLSTQFAELGTSTTHPIVWEQSRIKLTALSRQASALGPIKRPRTPEQVGQDLITAQKLLAQQRELAQHCQGIAQQHADLLTLLSGPDLSQGMEWYQSVQKLVERLAEYDPENWPRVDAVANLPAELEALAEGLRLRGPASASEPVPETEIAQRLQDTQELAQFFQGLRGRIENIQARLAEIQQGEELAREQLEAARAALNQMALLVRSNAFLEEIATQEVSRLQSSYEGLRADLGQRQRGSIDKKAKAVGGLMGKIESSSKNWLDSLNKDIEDQKQVMASKLSSLDKIARLDEPAIAEARRLLASSQAYATGSLPQRSKFGLDEIILDLKRRCDYWQACEAAIHGLEDVEQPLVSSYETASQNRQNAKEQLQEVGSWLRDSRTWPPTQQSLEAERREFDGLEKQWEALKQSQAKAISLVAELGHLSANYQSLSERIQQIAGRAVQDQERFETLERELDDLAQAWQSQWQAYRDNPMAGDEIHRLLGDISSERDQLKRQYRQGAKTYDQVLQALQALNRRVRVTQVSIDDNHVIDLNGRVITFR